MLGHWKVDDVEIKKRELDEEEKYLGGNDKADFLTFVRGMLQRRPEDRKTAAQLLKDPWLNREPETA